LARILIADDDEQVLLTLSEAVSSLGHEVETAPDGKVALEMFFRSEYDLVMTDLSMPEVDGIAVLKRVKAARPETAVIVVTGHSTMDLLAAAITPGVDAYVTKPFKLSEIDLQLKKILGRSRPQLEAVGAPRAWYRRFF
jgi:DNA-binding NtrC family response regulator